MPKFFFISLFLIFTGAVYAHYDPYHAPVPTVCPYNYGATCLTTTGKTCSQFAIEYNPTWFSSCQIYGSFFFCVNVPTLPQPVVQNICYPQGSICACSFGHWGGFYRYETGFIY